MMTTGSPRVSVIVNCYNGERYLDQALASIAAQTCEAWEIVFWDNASTDGSAAIAQRYAPRLRYFRGEQNVPLGAARNLAVQQARGEFITFLDTDDEYLPDALERLVRAMEVSAVDVCYGGIVKVDLAGRELGRELPRAREGDLLDALLRQFDIWVPAVIVRSAALAETGLGFDAAVTASEEYCLFVQLAAVRRMKSISEPFARYRIHEGALTNRSADRWAAEREYTLARLVAAHPGIEQKYRGGFREARARARYYRARWLLSRGERSAALAELRRNAWIDPRYTALFLLALLPGNAWDAVHRAWTHRARVGAR
jgi:glycosyltransferase involved in cell wall biosynthesis